MKNIDDEGGPGQSRAAERMRYSRPDFVETTAAREILKCLNTTLRERSISLVYGPSSAGKTCTSRHFVADRNRGPTELAMYTATGEETTPGKLLRNLLEAVGHGGHKIRTASLTKQIETALYPHYVMLIIEEAQELSNACFNCLWKLNEHIGIAIAYVANEDTFFRLQGPRDTLERIRGRIGNWTKVKKATENDVELIVTGWGVTGESEIAYCNLIADLHGLHALDRLLTRAATVANAIAIDIDTRLLRQLAYEAGWDTVEPENQTKAVLLTAHN